MGVYLVESAQTWLKRPQFRLIDVLVRCRGEKARCHYDYASSADQTLSEKRVSQRDTSQNQKKNAEVLSSQWCANFASSNFANSKIVRNGTRNVSSQFIPSIFHWSTRAIKGVAWSIFPERKRMRTQLILASKHLAFRVCVVFFSKNRFRRHWSAFPRINEIQIILVQYYKPRNQLRQTYLGEPERANITLWFQYDSLDNT